MSPTPLRSRSRLSHIRVRVFRPISRLSCSKPPRADLCRADAERIAAELQDLIVRAGQGPLARPSSDAADGATFDPEALALLDPATAAQLIAALPPAQRVTQARAQASWLSGFGYPVSHTELLAAWEAAGGCRRSALHPPRGPAPCCVRSGRPRFDCV